MAKSKEAYKPIHPSKQQRQNPYQQYEGSEDTITLSTEEKDGNGIRSSWETSRTFVLVVLIMADLLLEKLEFLTVAFSRTR